MLGCYNINLQLNYVAGTHKRGNTENVEEKHLKICSVHFYRVSEKIEFYRIGHLQICQLNRFLSEKEETFNDSLAEPRASFSVTDIIESD